MMRQNPDRMFIPHLQNSRIAGKDETLRPVKLNVLNRQTEVVVFYEQRPTGPQVVQQNLCTCETLRICFKKRFTCLRSVLPVGLSGKTQISQRKKPRQSQTNLNAISANY